MSSTIEWLARPGTKPEVWNPVTGCTKVSEGCRNCYAETIAGRFWHKQYPPVEGVVGLRPRPESPILGPRPRRFTDVQCHEDRLALPLHWRDPRTVFVNSMSDLYHDAVPDTFIDQVFGAMVQSPMHTFIILTKRPGRMRDHSNGLARLDPKERSLRVARSMYEHHPARDLVLAVKGSVGNFPWPLRNVWIGVSVEGQETADERIPILLDTPAVVRVVSAEPLLGPVDASKYLRQAKKFHLSASVPGMLANRSFFGLQDDSGRPLARAESEAELRALLARGVELIPCSNECAQFDERTGCPGHPQPRLDWVIVGGESGPQARPCDVGWIHSIVDQCRAASVPVFVKQLGAHPRVRPGRQQHWDWGGDIGVEREGKLFSQDGDHWRVHLRNRKGADPSEWVRGLRVREWPEVSRG